jgi:mitochondrial FAD-linked sulfhydryl oxidase
MRKEQTYGRALILLIMAGALYLIYSMFGGGGKVEGTTEAESGVLGPIYSKKMNNREIRERLGRSTWTLLHTMAAGYPAFPSAQHMKDTLSFIYLLSKLYPCGECAEHFQKLLGGLPPKVSSNDDFKAWLCDAHNVVNRRLGKKVVDCSRVDDMWRCGCEAD